MSNENYFDIKVDEIYQGVDGKVGNLSIGLVGSDNKYDLKAELSNSGEIQNHILDVINQVPEIFAEYGANGDVSDYISLSHYLVKESEYQIKKELEIPEYISENEITTPEIDKPEKKQKQKKSKGFGMSM